MGTWATGLYADDTTCDVRDGYVRALKEGLDDEGACARMVAAYGSDDPDRACLLYFALADTAWRHGRLNDAVRSRALALLAGGGDLARWAVDSPGDVAARKRVLRALETRLGTPQPAFKPVKVVPPKPATVRTTDPIGSAYRLDLPSGRQATFVLVAMADLGDSVDPVFSVIAAGGEAVDLGQVGKDTPTLRFGSGLGPQRHVAVIPEGRRSVMASLVPLGRAAAVPRLTRNACVWLSMGRIAKEIDAAFAAASV